MKLKVKSDSVHTDFTTKKSRLTKKEPSADFRLADNADFYGFDSKPIPVSKFERFMLIFFMAMLLVFLVNAIGFLLQRENTMNGVPYRNDVQQLDLYEQNN